METSESPELRPRHHWVVRVTHWVNVLAVVLMVGSGFRIFNAYPRFARKGETFCCYPFEGDPIPAWLTFGGWLAGARNWHFAAMWLLVVNGLIYVAFISFDDGYHESWDIDSALHRQTLIAYAMDGRLLSPAHGAPARLHSPIKLGYKSTKFLTRVVFMPQRNGGYWSDQGYEWYAGT
jgi:hypothetical protein